MKKINRYILAMVLAIPMLNACESNPQQSQEERADGIVLSKRVFIEAGMETAQMADTIFLDILSCSGQVDVFPGARRLISSPIGGMLNGFDALEGDRVNKGSLLFSIRNQELADLQYNYLESVAQHQLLAGQVHRARNLAESDAASRRELQAAEAAFAGAQARYQAMKKKMELLQLNPEKNGIVTELSFYAPFSGVVARRLASNGQFVSADQSVLELIDDTKKKLRIEITENQRVHIAEKQQVIVLRPGGEPSDIRAEILRISPLANPENSSVQLSAIFTEGDVSTLPVGAFVQVGIVTRSRRVTYLPAVAIIPKEGKQYVLVVEETTDESMVIVPVEVATGATSGAMVEILSPHTLADKQLISKGAFQLLQ